MRTIGIYNPNLSTMGGGEKVCLALAESLRDDGWKVCLITEKPVKKAKLEAYFGVSLQGIDVKLIGPSRIIRRFDRSRAPHAVRKLILNLVLYRQISVFNLDVFVNNAYNTELPSPAKTGVYMCMFPHKLPDKAQMNPLTLSYFNIMRWLSRVLFPGGRYWLDGYQTITANSAYTQSYIRQYWNRDSQILYPISENAWLKDVKKQNMILNVGRFFNNDGIQHHKRQDFLLDVFKKMDSLIAGGWQLHFAGTVNQTPHDMAYVLDLLRRSDGYPVYFHLDTPLHKLRELYSQSTLYWHATGYGTDVKKSPERQEHFGISTVEAMSAGAVPVVIDSAGQQEIVSEGSNGYLWKSEKELIAKTDAAISHAAQLAAQAQLDAKHYNKLAFKTNVRNIFGVL